MKKLNSSRKRYLLSRAISEKRKRRRRKGKSRVRLSSIVGAIPSNIYSGGIEVKAPRILNLQFENVNNVLEFIAKIKAIGENRNESLIINLRDVVEIGEGAIAMMLTVIDEFRQLNPQIPIRGYEPSLEIARDILEKSGFFKYMSGYQIKESNRVEKNTIFTIGTINKSQYFLPKIIHEAMDTVWGIKGRNPLLYTVAFEMIRNSCDHAFKRENLVKWYLAATHLEEDNLVKFSFVDNGKGILKTLNEGKLERFKHMFIDNADILTTAFKDGIKSRTGLSWRGKGLPTIYENYEENYIRNLIVISNDVFIDFDNKIYTKLNSPFSGTYYYWVVDRLCEKVCFL